MNRKVKSFNQTVFLSEQCAVSKDTTRVRSAVFRPWHRRTIILPLVYCLINYSRPVFSGWHYGIVPGAPCL